MYVYNILYARHWYSWLTALEWRDIRFIKMAAYQLIIHKQLVKVHTKYAS